MNKVSLFDKGQNRARFNIYMDKLKHWSLILYGQKEFNNANQDYRFISSFL